MAAYTDVPAAICHYTHHREIGAKRWEVCKLLHDWRTCRVEIGGIVRALQHVFIMPTSTEFINGFALRAFVLDYIGVAKGILIRTGDRDPNTS